MHLSDVAVWRSVDPWTPTRAQLRDAPNDAADSLAADPKSARYNQRSVTAAELAREYGFTDVDGTQPDAWARL
jgi:hypothetical protein